MGDLCRLIWGVVAGLFRTRAALHAEILVLRHQLNVLRRKSPKRLAFNNLDRLVFVGLYGLAPKVRGALTMSQARNGDRLAPRRFPSLLALEIKTAGRPAESIDRGSRSHS